MTRDQAYDFNKKCKENESMNRRPTFTRYEDGYKNGDILPSIRPGCEYIFIDYNNLTLKQITKMFHYLTDRKCDFDRNKSVIDEYCKNDVNMAKDMHTLITKRNSTKIKKVHFNPPVTVVIWEDGTKTIVRTQGEDTFDPEKGLAIAISKKVLGNNGAYYDEFKKWLDPYYEELEYLERARTAIENLIKSFNILGSQSNVIAVGPEEPNYTEDGE